MVAKKKPTRKKVTKKTTQSKAAKPAKPSAAKKTKEPITIDRRDKNDRRLSADRRNKTEPVSGERRVLERRAKVNRRRQIDPTTCERDYSSDEIEFMSAMDQYKRTSGRMFPTCSEVLEVLRSLGYQKMPVAQPQTDRNEQEDSDQLDQSEDERTEPLATPWITAMPHIDVAVPTMIG